MYLTDIIGSKYETWKQGEWIFLKSPPGSGKTTFCNQYARKMVREGKSVLMLSPRRVLVNQQKSQAMQNIAKQDEGYFREIDGINYSGYQSLEKSLLNGYDPLSSFDIIICDECHYFLSDAVFNPLTQISLEAILEQRKSIILFLSGTIEDFEKYIFSKFDCRLEEKKNGDYFD